MIEGEASEEVIPALCGRRVAVSGIGDESCLGSGSRSWLPSTGPAT